MQYTPLYRHFGVLIGLFFLSALGELCAVSCLLSPLFAECDTDQQLFWPVHLLPLFFIVYPLEIYAVGELSFYLPCYREYFSYELALCLSHILIPQKYKKCYK